VQRCAYECVRLKVYMCKSVYECVRLKVFTCKSVCMNVCA